MRCWIGLRGIVFGGRFVGGMVRGRESGDFVEGWELLGMVILACDGVTKSGEALLVVVVVVVGDE